MPSVFTLTLGKTCTLSKAATKTAGPLCRDPGSDTRQSRQQASMWPPPAYMAANEPPRGTTWPATSWALPSVGVRDTRKVQNHSSPSIRRDTTITWMARHIVCRVFAINTWQTTNGKQSAVTRPSRGWHMRLVSECGMEALGKQCHCTKGLAVTLGKHSLCRVL